MLPNIPNVIWKSCRFSIPNMVEWSIMGTMQWFLSQYSTNYWNKTSSLGISVEASVPANSSFTAAHIWLLACQTQIIANIVQFAFVLFTMAKEERVKENGGRGLPLSLQSLQGGSTVDTGDNLNLILQQSKIVDFITKYGKNIM